MRKYNIGRGGGLPQCGNDIGGDRGAPAPDPPVIHIGDQQRQNVEITTSQFQGPYIEPMEQDGVDGSNVSVFRVRAMRMRITKNLPKLIAIIGLIILIAVGIILSLGNESSDNDNESLSPQSIQSKTKSLSPEFAAGGLPTNNPDHSSLLSLAPRSNTGSLAPQQNHQSSAPLPPKPDHDSLAPQPIPNPNSLAPKPNHHSLAPQQIPDSLAPKSITKSLAPKHSLDSLPPKPNRESLAPKNHVSLAPQQIPKSSAPEQSANPNSLPPKPIHHSLAPQQSSNSLAPEPNRESLPPETDCSKQPPLTQTPSDSPHQQKTVTPTGIPPYSVDGFFSVFYNKDDQYSNPTNTHDVLGKDVSVLDGVNVDVNSLQQIECKNGGSYTEYAHSLRCAGNSPECLYLSQQKLRVCTNRDQLRDKYGIKSGETPPVNVYGGIYSRCRAQHTGIKPINGWPDSPIHCIGSAIADGGNCQCPDGFSEAVISGGFTDKYTSGSGPLGSTPAAQCPIYEHGSFGMREFATIAMIEIVLCYNPNQWKHGDYFGGMFSEVGAGYARNTDPHDYNVVYMSRGNKRPPYVVNDKTFGNPLNNLKHECPCGYTKYQIGEYCSTQYCSSAHQDKRIQHYVCLNNAGGQYVDF